MAWTHRDTEGATTTSAGTSVTATKPVGTVAGDLLYVITRSGNGVMIDDSGSFTQISLTTSGSANVQTWWKIAGSAEPSTYTFHCAGAGGTTHFLLISAYVQPTAGTVAVDVHGEAANASSANICAPSVTPTGADDLLVWGGWIGGGGANITPPSGFTEPAGGDLSATHRVATSYVLSVGTTPTGDEVAVAAAAAANIGTLTAFRVVSATGATADLGVASATASAQSPTAPAGSLATPGAASATASAPQVRGKGRPTGATVLAHDAHVVVPDGTANSIDFLTGPSPQDGDLWIVTLRGQATPGTNPTWSPPSTGGTWTLTANNPTTNVVTSCFVCIASGIGGAAPPEGLDLIFTLSAPFTLANATGVLSVFRPPPGARFVLDGSSNQNNAGTTATTVPGVTTTKATDLLVHASIIVGSVGVHAPPDFLIPTAAQALDPGNRTHVHMIETDAGPAGPTGTIAATLSAIATNSSFLVAVKFVQDATALLGVATATAAAQPPTARGGALASLGVATASATALPPAGLGGARALLGAGSATAQARPPTTAIGGTAILGAGSATAAAPTVLARGTPVLPTLRLSRSATGTVGGNTISFPSTGIQAGDLMVVLLFGVTTSPAVAWWDHGPPKWRWNGENDDGQVAYATYSHVSGGNDPATLDFVFGDTFGSSEPSFGLLTVYTPPPGFAFRDLPDDVNNLYWAATTVATTYGPTSSALSDIIVQTVITKPIVAATPDPWFAVSGQTDSTTRRMVHLWNAYAGVVGAVPDLATALAGSAEVQTYAYTFLLQPLTAAALGVATATAQAPPITAPVHAPAALGTAALANAFALPPQTTIGAHAFLGAGTATAVAHPPTAVAGALALFAPATAEAEAFPPGTVGSSFSLLGVATATAQARAPTALAAALAILGVAPATAVAWPPGSATGIIAALDAARADAIAWPPAGPAGAVALLGVAPANGFAWPLTVQGHAFALLGPATADAVAPLITLVAGTGAAIAVLGPATATAQAQIIVVHPGTDTGFPARPTYVVRVAPAPTVDRDRVGLVVGRRRATLVLVRAAPVIWLVRHRRRPTIVRVRFDTGGFPMPQLNGKFDFVQGDTIQETWRFYEEDGATPIAGFSGADVFFTARDNSDAVILAFDTSDYITITDASNAVVAVEVPYNVTDVVPIGAFPYDIQITEAGPDPRRVTTLEFGTMTVAKQYTRKYTAGP